MKTKLIALIGLLLLALSTAVEAQQIHFAYTNNGDGTVTVTQAYYTSYFRHPGGPFTIPGAFNGLPVTSIGSDFSDPWGLYFTSITIPATVTNIGGYAFEDDNYLTSIYFEGSPPVVGPFTFETHSQGNTTAYYLAAASGWGDDTNGAPTNYIFAAFGQGGVQTAVWSPQTSSLQVKIAPAAAITAGAQWQVDGGPANDSGATVAGLVTGAHTVSFTALPGWTSPPDQSITVKYNSTAAAAGMYKAWPADTAPLAVQVSGNGLASPNDNGKLLKLGQAFQMKAVPASGWIFSNWVASGSGDFVSDNPILKFTMQSGLVLQANFSPDPFLGVAGKYIGLFTPSDGDTVQNSGLVSLTLTTKGTFSGYLQTGATRHTLTGQFDVNGNFTNTLNIKGGDSLSIGLNVPVSDSTGSLYGVISEGNSTATLNANQLVSGKVVFTGSGRYTIYFEDSDDDGTGSAVMNFTKSGPTTLAGRLPDGTRFSASTIYSPLSGDNPQWMFFTPVGGGKGCLLVWLSGPDGTGDDSVAGNVTEIQPAGTVIQMSASGGPGL